MGNTQKHERILWADICKGLLITLLMFSHLVWISKGQSINNSVIGHISDYSGIWDCFFMSCFFLVSGMFSNFNKEGKVFLWGNFKSLIIPALVSLAILCLPSFNWVNFLKMAFFYGGGLWFLSSLFLSKLFFWACIKLIKRDWIVIALLLVLSFAGKWLDDLNLFPNYWYHRNFLNFCLYLGVGYYLKDYIIKKSMGVISSVAFVITIAIIFVMGVRIPNVVAVFNESLAQHPLTIWLSITGSIACIHLCKLIAHSAVLEFLGRNSLIVYIYHMFLLPHCISAISLSLNGGALVNSVLMVFMIVVSILVFCSGLAVVIDTKYFRWMKGVF